MLSSEPSSSCLPQQLKREVSAWMSHYLCVWLFLVIFSVLRLTPLGRPGSSAACGDSCRQQHAAGPGPQSGLPLSGTSCVSQKPLLPLLHPPFRGALLCFCAPCPVAIMMPSVLPCSKSFLVVLPPV